MGGLAFVGLGAGIVPLGLLLFLIVAIAGGRNEPDPAGERPAALYYAAVLFLTLFTALFAVFGVGASLLKLTTHDHSRYAEVAQLDQGMTFGPDGGGRMVPLPAQRYLREDRGGEHDGDWANALRAAVIAGIAIAVYVFHDRRRKSVRLGPGGDRVRRTYLYAVSFVAVATFVIAGGLALYAIVEVIAPGVTSAGTRGDAAVQFGQAALLALLAFVVAQNHLPLADFGAAREGASGGGHAASSSLLVPEPVPAVLPDEEPAPRKRAPAKKAAAKKTAKKAAKAAKKRA